MQGVRPGLSAAFDFDLMAAPARGWIQPPDITSGVRTCCTALLTDLARRVEPNLSAIADEVGQRTLKDILIDAQALSVVEDVTESERDLHTIMGPPSSTDTAPHVAL